MRLSVIRTNNDSLQPRCQRESRPGNHRGNFQRFQPDVLSEAWSARQDNSHQRQQEAKAGEHGASRAKHRSNGHASVNQTASAAGCMSISKVSKNFEVMM